MVARELEGPLIVILPMLVDAPGEFVRGLVEDKEERRPGR